MGAWGRSVRARRCPGPTPPAASTRDPGRSPRSFAASAGLAGRPLLAAGCAPPALHEQSKVGSQLPWHGPVGKRKAPLDVTRSSQSWNCPQTLLPRTVCLVHLESLFLVVRSNRGFGDDLYTDYGVQHFLGYSPI